MGTILWIIGIAVFAIYCWFGGFLAGAAVADGALNHRLVSFRFRILLPFATLFWPVLLLANAVEERRRKRKGESL